MGYTYKHYPQVVRRWHASYDALFSFDVAANWRAQVWTAGYNALICFLAFQFNHWLLFILLGFGVGGQFMHLSYTWLMGEMQDDANAGRVRSTPTLTEPLPEQKIV